MKTPRPLVLGAAALLALCTPALAAGSMTQDVKAINDSWAHIAYEVRGSSSQTRQLDALAQQAAALVARYPNQAEPAALARDRRQRAGQPGQLPAQARPRHACT